MIKPGDLVRYKQRHQLMIDSHWQDVFLVVWKEQKDNKVWLLSTTDYESRLTWTLDKGAALDDVFELCEQAPLDALRFKYIEKVFKR